MPHSFILGYTGAHRDRVTGGFPLGNGYRVYVPQLMRFTAPDSLSPFGRGGPHPYIYCMDDPINRTDPSGHVPVSEFEEVAGEAVRHEQRAGADSIAAGQAVEASSSQAPAGTSSAPVAHASTTSFIAPTGPANPNAFNVGPNSLAARRGVRVAPLQTAHPLPLLHAGASLSARAVVEQIEAIEREFGDTERNVREMQQIWRGRWRGRPNIRPQAEQLHRDADRLLRQVDGLSRVLHDTEFQSERSRVSHLQESLVNYARLTRELVDELADLARRDAESMRTPN